MICSQPPTGSQGPSQEIKERRPRPCPLHLPLPFTPCQAMAPADPLLSQAHMAPGGPGPKAPQLLTLATPLPFLHLPSVGGLLQHAVNLPEDSWVKLHLTSALPKDDDHPSYGLCWTLDSYLTGDLCKTLGPPRVGPPRGQRPPRFPSGFQCPAWSSEKAVE